MIVGINNMNEKKKEYEKQVTEIEEMLFQNTGIVEIDKTAHYSLQRLMNKQSGPAYGKNYHKQIRIVYDPNTEIASPN